MNDDPLRSIVVDETERVNRARHMLATILQSYAEISEQTGELTLLLPVYELPPKEQILIVLCGRLAQKYLNKLPSGQDEKFSQTEIVQMLPTMPIGTVKSNLKRLRDENFITNTEKKNFVSAGHLVKIQNRIKALNKGGSS